MVARISPIIGYITEFLPESFSSHPDFASTSYIMNVISPTTNAIVSESGIIIGSAVSETATSFTPTLYSTTNVVVPSAGNQQTTTNVWGDGSLMASAGEECDDGNLISGDGWNSSCKIEAGYAWTTNSSAGNKSYCSRIWGNGKIDAPEECDDANFNSGDGWNISWLKESGYSRNMI